MDNQKNNKTTILLADDHSMIRQGLIFMIEDSGLECDISHASNLQQILETVKATTIDIAIVDAHFPDGNSLTIIPELRKINSEIKILIYTGIDETTQSLKFINAGANGFLSKLSEEDEVQQAILKIHKEGEYLSPVTQALLINSIRNPKLINPLLNLTERELQIAKLYTEGLGNLEIANQLNIKQNTVSTLKKRIFEKLNIENIVDLINLIKQYY